MPDIIYCHCWDESGAYSHDEIAQPDQMNPGNYLLPENATFDPVPSPQPNTFPVRVNGTWVLMPDYRSLRYWSKTTKIPISLSIGQTPDSTMTDIEPSQDQVWDDTSGAWHVPASILIDRISNLIDSERLRREQLNIVFNGNTFQADDKSTKNMSATLILYSIGIPVPDPIGWRDANNITRMMSISDLKSLSASIFVRAENLYDQAWALKDALSSLSQTELETYDLSLRWPA